MDIDVEAFKELSEGTGILIYPCLYGWPSRYMPIPPDLARGLAVNYWYQGADGLYTFNWFPFEPEKTYQVVLLQEIGDPETLHGRPMIFAADRGRPAKEYPHNWMRAVLPVTLRQGEEVAVPVTIGEDPVRLHHARVALHVEYENASDEDAIAVRVNQRPLSNGSRRDSRVVVPLTPDALRQGRNEITVHLNRGYLMVTAIEIHVEMEGT
jgi:hypothetical protein